jgi:hypothetical protein
MATNSFEFYSPYTSGIQYTTTNAYATTAMLFNTMIATSAISLGITAAELEAFKYAVNAEGVTAMHSPEMIYKGILNAAMKIIEKRGD